MANPLNFNEAEAKVIRKLLDAFFADLGAEEAEEVVACRGEGISEEEARAFARRSASECGDVVSILSQKLAAGRPCDGLWLHVLLKSLASKSGCLALTGRRGPLYNLETSVVQDVWREWLRSSVLPVRFIGKVLKMLGALTCLGAIDGQENPNWKVMGYSTPDMARIRQAALSTEAADFGACRVPDLFSQHPSPDTAAGPKEIIVDCIVVGSGPGGSVVAAELTEAGYQVALLETSVWRSSQEQSCSEFDGVRESYVEAGNLYTEHAEIGILAGAAFGGGAAVNWSCCLPPPQKVREEWARDFGIEWAAGDEMQQSVEQARERLSMHTEGVELNGSNQVLMRGCERLGYQAEVAAQQGWEPKSPDDGGLCTVGWKHGSRQGMHGSALLDAARTGKLLVLDGCFAEAILRDSAGRACAVKAMVRRGGSTCPVLVRGRSVVVSGGALQTPLLLRRSGLKNKNIGRHLHLHPATTVWGRFKEPIRFFEGAPMTTVSRVVEDQDGQGYGAKIWCPNLHPMYWAAWRPWHGPKEFKQALAGYAHAAPLIILVRDQGEGKVWEDRDGSVRVSYSTRKMTRADKKHLVKAMEHACRILVAAGAQEVHSSQTNLKPLHVDESAPDQRTDLEAWLARLHAAGVEENAIELGSAHQMGTCRMAGNPKLGAIKPSGESWEVPGLFVADTSAFPTASGVNPMWTCAALAHRVAQQVKGHLATAPEVQSPRPLRTGISCATACAAAPAPVSKKGNGSAPARANGCDDASSSGSASTADSHSRN